MGRKRKVLVSPDPVVSESNGKAVAPVVARRLPRERVLCFPSGFLQPWNFTAGFRTDVPEWVNRLLMVPGPSRGGVYKGRTKALEALRQWKQVVAVAVLYDEQERAVWLYRRKGTETRLHDKVSCLVGGHVNSDDGDRALRPTVDGRKVSADPLDSCWFAVQRELAQELGPDVAEHRWTDKPNRQPYRTRLIGVVNDESTPVDRAHFGVVYQVKHSMHSIVPVGDLGGEPLGWFRLPVGEAGSGEHEPWTRHVLGYLAGLP